MTRQREFKALVRERMSHTGERYTAARTHLLQSTPPAPATVASTPGLAGGYDRFGGIQGDTGALCNVLRQAGIESPLTKAPFTETMVNGLCGGPGFLYATFEYKCWPPMLSLALRSRSMDDLYIGDGLARLGVEVKTSETSSASAARKALDEALARGTAALCVADTAHLPWYGLPAEFAGGAPRVVAVAGRDGADLWIDDRSTRPIRLDEAAFAKARAGYRNAKHRLVTIEGAASGYDWRAAAADAIATTARRYTEPAVPKSFWVNCGFSGLAKWQRMLTDRKDAKGWPSLFAEGTLAYAGLQRAFEWIEGPAGPAAGRGLYADFLDEVSGPLGRKALKEAATAFRESGRLWSEAAGVIAACGDKAIREGCEIAERRFELSDVHGEGVSAASAELWQKRHAIGESCRLSKEKALAVFGQLAPLVGGILAAERSASELLSA